MSSQTTLIVLAKAPVAGRSKTRLTPPCSPQQAADLAEAALRDTCDAVAAVASVRRLLVLDGAVGAWLPTGFDVTSQCDGTLADRLGHAFSCVDGPALLIGMDTPQITPSMLEAGLRQLRRRKTDAVIGPAVDGGFWAIGFNDAAPGAFANVTMSARDTLPQQRRQLASLGLTVTDLEVLRDVDEIADAHEVAALIPGSRFARELANVTRQTVALS